MRSSSPLCASIFFFVLYSNYFALVPGVGSIGVCRVEHAAEGAAHIPPSPTFASLPGYCPDGKVIPALRAPSSDLNVTLAWALAAVPVNIQLFGFHALGVGYLTKFFNFREGAMGFLVGLLELISELVQIIAFSFRLFGNIFAGEVVLGVMAYLFAYLLPLPFYGLELFVAFMQAFVFSVLTLVFMSLATISHGGHDEHGHAETMPIEAANMAGHGGSALVQLQGHPLIIGFAVVIDHEIRFLHAIRYCFKEGCIMTDAGLRLLAAALAVGLGAIGPGIGIGIVFSGALTAMGRNPKLGDAANLYPILGFALTKSLFIFALVVSLLIAFGII